MEVKYIHIRLEVGTCSCGYIGVVHVVVYPVCGGILYHVPIALHRPHGKRKMAWYLLHVPVSPTYVASFQALSNKPVAHE